MKKLIHKLELISLNFAEHVTYKLPRDFSIIHAGEQNGSICLWYEFPSALYDDTLVPATFYVIGTGQEFDWSTEHKHVGTVQGTFGLVWHVFQADRC